MRRQQWIGWTLCGMLLQVSISVLAQVPVDAVAEPTVDDLLKPGVNTLPLMDPGRPELTLSQALQLAGERNLTLDGMAAELAVAEAQVRRAAAMFLPTITAGLNYTRLDRADELDPSVMMGDAGALLPSSDPIVLRRQDDLGGVLTVQVPLLNLPIFGALRTSRIAAEVTRLSVAQARTAVLYATAQAWYMSLVSLSLIHLQEEQIRATAVHLEVASRREAAGAGLRIDVLRARTALAQARQDLDDAYMSLDAACDALGVLTGMGRLPLPVDEESLLSDMTPPGGDPDALSLTARRDLALLSRSRDLADDQLRAARLALFPSLTGLWRGTHQFTEMSAMSDPRKTRWSIMLMLNVPLLDAGSYAGIRLQRATLERASLRLAEAEQSARQEVRQVLREYQSSLRARDNAGMQVALTREALALATAAFESGAGTSMDVTDARRVASAAEVGLLTAGLKVQLALLAILQATGEDPSQLR